MIAPAPQIRRTPLLPVQRLDHHQFVGRDPALWNEINLLRSEWKAALERLAGLNRRQQHGAVRQLLHSTKFSIFHAYRGVLKAKLIRGATRQSLQTLASRLDPFMRCSEGVDRRYFKDGRKVRLIHAYGPLKRAHQHMVADVIRALHLRRGKQFLFHGGILAALRAVEAAYARGLTHAVELDVEDFYGSIPKACLAERLRPLPAAVVEHVVWDDTIRVAGNGMSGVVSMAWVPPPLNDAVGLSLGSASSPVVGEVLLGHLLADPRVSDLDIITYADNLLVLGRTAEETEASADRLMALAREPDHGSLRLREKDSGHLVASDFSPGGRFAAGVPFAGQFGQVDNEGCFTWEPAPMKRLEHMIAQADDCPSLAAIERAQAKVAAFHRAYPFWRDRDISEAEDRAALSAARYMADPSPDALSAAGRDLLLASLMNRGRRFLDELIPTYDGIPEVRRERLAEEVASLHSRIFSDPEPEQAPA